MIHSTRRPSRLYGGLGWGKVTVKADGKVLCTFAAKAANGGGICAPARKQLRPGTYTIQAFFTSSKNMSGSGNFAPSKSVIKRLTVTS